MHINIWKGKDEKHTAQTQINNKLLISKRPILFNEMLSTFFPYFSLQKFGMKFETIKMKTILKFSAVLK